MNDEWGDLDFRNESNDLWVVISTYLYVQNTYM